MRVCVLGGVLLWLCPVFTVAGIGLGLPISAAIAVGIAAAAAVAFFLTPTILRAIAPSLKSSRLLRVSLVLLTAVAILRIAWLSMFMGNAGLPAYSLAPDDVFRTQHSCMSSYAEAARFLDEGASNIYDARMYQPRFLGALKVDPYHYPPPFLLVPQAVRAATGDFFRFRALWFAFQMLVMATALIMVAVWLGGTAGTIALTGSVLLLGLPGVLYGFQQGNFQVTAAPICVVAIILMSGRHLPSGTMLLAYAAAAKIFPGVLVVYLAAARRWRALAWVAVAGVLLLGLTLALQGVGPTRAFLTHALPEISSGAAFPHTEQGRTSTMNWTVYGLTVRLRHLGITALDQPAGLRVASIYGLLVIGLAAWAGWRHRVGLETRPRQLTVLQVSLALLALASFRSPFAGAPYGSMSTLWLTTFLAAGAASLPRSLAWLGGMIALASAIWALPSPSHDQTRVTLVLSGLLFLGCLALNLWAVWRGVNSLSVAERPAEAAAPLGAAVS